MNSFHMRINGYNLANTVVHNDPIQDEGTMIDTAEGIKFFQMTVERLALKMEIKGLKHSSGKSVCARIKKLHKLKGDKQSVLEQFTKLIEKEFNLKEGTLK